MKLIAVGDLHGETDGLFRLLDTEAPDGLLCVGDWGDPGEVSADVWDALLERVPVLTVFGNHDDLPTLASLRNRDGSAVLLQQAERRDHFCSFAIAGVSGIWAKSHRLPHYVTDEDVAGWAAQLAAAAQAPVDILLTHGCPIGIADRTPSGRPGGQRCFLDLWKAVQPAVYLCGHIHVAQRRDFVDPPATVLNTGSLRDNSYVVVEKAANGAITADLRFVSASRT